MGKIEMVKKRLYADYLMPSRLDEYEKLIKKTIELGYIHITLAEYALRLKENTLSDKKYFIHRHDIDTDVKTAKKFFEIEKRYKIKTTYYFRLATLDIDFMKQINKYGSEASYHYEELSSYCKKNQIKDAKKAKDFFPKIREIFINNFLEIEKKLGYKLETISAHGDFVNRSLKIYNNELIDDNLKKKLDVSCEAYDKDIMNSFDVYISEVDPPKYYSPVDVFEALDNYKVICLLTHPRQWRVSIFANTIDNINRFYEGMKWK